MKISGKKKTALYDLVHEEIMQARIKIARLLNGTKERKEVDNVLSDLTLNAPQKAIDFFESPSTQGITD